MGIVGESGSGKSTLLRAIVHLLSSAASVEGGSVVFAGNDITHAPRKHMNKLRGAEISYLFQNAEQALDPLFKIGDQFDEVLKAHARQASREFEAEFLSRMGFEDPMRTLRSIPSQLSGGMAQRVAMAFALAGQPRLLLADEPTSSLDADAQKRTVELLREINQTENLAILLVSHDIGLVSTLAESMLVMRKGRVVESGACSEVVSAPRNPYTRELIESIPRMPDTWKGEICSL